MIKSPTLSNINSVGKRFSSSAHSQLCNFHFGAVPRSIWLKIHGGSICLNEHRRGRKISHSFLIHIGLSDAQVVCAEHSTPTHSLTHSLTNPPIVSFVLMKGALAFIKTNTPPRANEQTHISPDSSHTRPPKLCHRTGDVQKNNSKTPSLPATHTLQLVHSRQWLCCSLSN